GFLPSPPSYGSCFGRALRRSEGAARSRARGNAPGDGCARIQAPTGRSKRTFALPLRGAGQRAGPLPRALPWAPARDAPSVRGFERPCNRRTRPLPARRTIQARSVLHDPQGEVERLAQVAAGAAGVGV